MADQIATSFETPNYSGLLFNKGNTRTPFSSMIGGKTKMCIRDRACSTICAVQAIR